MTNTDPNHWFLPAASIPRAPAFTSGNRVSALIDGEAYYSHLSTRITGMVAGDFFHISGWRVTPTQSLRPTVAGSPTFLKDVQDMLASGVTVRAMIWYFPGSILGIAPNHPGENIDFVREVINAGGEAILDERFPRGVFASHHQKTIVLQSGGDHWGYVGGLDICVDRWDTPQHNNASPPRTREFFDAWHDVHTVTQGPAVAQLWDNFTDRWNDRTPPHTGSFAPGGTPPALIPTPGPAPGPVGGGTHHVQVLRTLACGIYPFATAGEQTVRSAYEHAIDRAEHYIYIEDQYFWPSTTVTRLVAAAGRGVKIILVMSHNYDAPGLIYYHNQMRFDAIESIRAANPASLFTYHLQRPANGADIYCHSKLMIIDDCYAVVGTANVGRRSYTTDSELDVAVVDSDTIPSTMDGVPATVCRYAAELRINLWAEHLGLAGTAAIVDPIAGLAAWPVCPAAAPAAPALPSQTHHAVCHYVPTPRFRFPAFIPNGYMNVDTVCD
ncbi:MAG: hypothetical protein IT340_18045 [Chloroflexi bacterium]|nr:hypothetical protein [Chloroflexota bacterium]